MTVSYPPLKINGTLFGGLVMKNSNESKVYANNKKAFHDYKIVDKLICGIELKGNEVKSIKNSEVSIKESWVDIEDEELYIKKMYIKKWETSNIFDSKDEARDRKLLATKKQIRLWSRCLKLKRYTIVPLRVFNSNGKIKVEIGLALGKHSYDKRQDDKIKTMKREAQRV